MITLAALSAYVAVVAGFVITPGPNVAYIVSRSVAEGPRAGLVSAFGVMWGYVFYLLCAALGLTALLIAVPAAYEALRWAGVAYLLYLAWQALTAPAPQPNTPDAAAPGDGRVPTSNVRLAAMGFATNVLNPNIAMFYLSLLPQFVDPARGSVFGQYLLLGAIHIVAQAAVHVALILTAGRLASSTRAPAFAAAQRYVLGGVLGALAVKLMLDRRPV